LHVVGMVLHPERDSAEAVAAILGWAQRKRVLVLGVEWEISRLKNGRGPRRGSSDRNRIVARCLPMLAPRLAPRGSGVQCRKWPGLTLRCHGTVPRGTTHCMACPVILAMRS
jgi:hypothetical protein